MLNGTARGKELRRAKQAGQQRASGSDCNLAVNRTLTTNHMLPAWVGKIWLCRRTTSSNAMNCSVGVSASSIRVHTRRYDPAASVEASRNSRKSSSSSWWSALSNSVNVPRQTCGKSSSRCRTNNDTTEQYDFRQRSASSFQITREPSFRGRFVVHTFECARLQTRATQACRPVKMEPSSIYRVAALNEQEQ